ncbi:hypothetical protein I552_6166 [Mycobacterium xenopi 3993]|nr:hypothetical protein I552_6166 [Mycobacterium xenopi 3993]
MNGELPEPDLGLDVPGLEPSPQLDDDELGRVLEALLLVVDAR